MAGRSLTLALWLAVWPASAQMPASGTLSDTTVLGLKAHGNSLWLLSNSDDESALIHYDLASTRVVRRYPVAGAGHVFNDLAIARAGDVYLTDTRAGAVWHLATGSTDLAKLPERFEFANGIALSPDGRLFYMANIQDDKKTGFNPITILKLHL